MQLDIKRSLKDVTISILYHKVICFLFEMFNHTLKKDLTSMITVYKPRIAFPTPVFRYKKSQGIFPTAKLHSASQPGWLSLLPPERAASFQPRKKNGPTFHSKNWLVNRDPYVMAYEIIPVGFLISQKNLTNQGPFFHCSFKTTCLDAPCIHGNPGNPRKSFIFTGVLRPTDSGPKTVIFQFWGTKAMKYLPTFLEN